MKDSSSTTGRMSEEGLLITLSAVRMSLKNSIIVTAIRDGINFAEADYSAIAVSELLKLSKRSHQDAERVEKQRKQLTKFKGTYSYDEDTRQDVKLLARRRKVYEQLEVALRAVAEDELRVATLVSEAQDDATAELVGSVAARLVAQALVAQEPDYEKKRVKRMQDLVNIDLALLQDVSSPEY